MKLSTLAAAMLTGALMWIGILYILVPKINQLVVVFRGVVG